MRLLLVAFLPALLLLAACARPLSDNEDAFAAALFGNSLNRDAVTVRAGIGVLPLPPAKPDTAADSNAPRPARAVPDGFCTRVPSPSTGPRWPAAFVLWDDVFFSYKYYKADTFAGWPNSVPLPQFLIMSHELVHVWQWQNRDQTQYRPSRSAAEAGIGIDPYYWQIEPGREFLSYGFEQQAAMVEDYLCYRLFERENPRLRDLHAIIDPVLPLAGLERFLAQEVAR